MGPRRVTIGTLSDELDKLGAFEGIEGPEYDPYTGARQGAAPRRELFWPVRMLLVLLLAAASLLALGTLAIRLLVDADEVAAWIAPRASAALHREVTLGGASISLLPRPGVTISDIRVANLEGFQGPALALIDRVRFDIAMMPLLGQRVSIARARVHGARVHLAVDEHGVSNFGDLVPEVTGSSLETPAPVSFGLHEISFADATLTYFDDPQERSLAVAGTSGALQIRRGSGGGWIVDGIGWSDSLHVRAPRISGEMLRTDGPRFTFVARGDDTFDWIEIESGRIEQSGGALMATGRVGGITEAAPYVDLSFDNDRLSAGVLSALIPTGARSRSRPRGEGTLQVALRLRGPLTGGTGPVLAGTVNLSDVGFRLNGASFLEGVDGIVEIGADTVALDAMYGTFAQGPFEMSGTLAGVGREIELALRASPQLDALGRLLRAPEGTSLAGRAMLDLAVSGSLDSIRNVGVEGTMNVTGAQLGHPRIGVPIYVPQADLEMNGTEASWDDLTVMMGQEPLHTRGVIRGLLASWWLDDETPEIEASIEGERLVYETILPDEGSGLNTTYAQIVFAHLGNRVTDGSHASIAASRAGLRRPRTLPLRGTVDLRLGALTKGNFELERVTARVALTDSTLAIEGAEAGIWGGRMSGSLLLGVGQRPDEPFALTLHGEGLDALSFFSSLTPAGDAIDGTMALRFEAAGTTDAAMLPGRTSLSGTGTMSVAGGSVSGTGVNLALADFLAEEWADVAFSSWTTDFGIADGVVQVSRSELFGEAGTAAAAGAVEFGGAVNVALSISIPSRRLPEGSLRRTGVAPSVLDHLRATGSVLDLGIRMSGPLEGPTLEPDALAVSELAVPSARP